VENRGRDLQRKGEFAMFLLPGLRKVCFAAFELDGTAHENVGQTDGLQT